MTKAQIYERFVRNAFGYKKAARGFAAIQKKEDPDCLADASMFKRENLTRTKAATSYAMCIYTSVIYSHSQIIKKKEHKRIDELISNVVKATSLNTICNQIQEFECSVIERYLELKNGKMVLKKI